jgi:hypothetical protein
MPIKHSLTARLATLQSWRYGINAQIARVADFVRENGFGSRDREREFDDLTAAANATCVTVVFVAEAGRGKSELINALFFGDVGHRLLPPSSHQITRCITEIRYRRKHESCLRLLPVETREAPKRFREIYDDDSQWQTIPFDAGRPESVAQAFAALAETRRISVNDAVALGLHSDSLRNKSAEGGWVDIPKWRYAVINFPHPLLDAGLVVIDTPGLAALAAEPEFTRENLPAADAVVVVLDAAEGVTKPDLAIWKDQLGSARSFRDRERDESGQARLVVLNKIDLLHTADPDNPVEADRRWLKEVDKRVQDVADLMRVETLKVLPVSASLALKGMLEKNQDLKLRSRLYRLERALAEYTVAQREITLGRTILSSLSDTLANIQAGLDQSRFDLLANLRTLSEVRQKNSTMLEKLGRESGDKQRLLEAAKSELRAVKPIHTKLAAELAAITHLDQPKADAGRAINQLAGGILASKTNETITEYFVVTRKRFVDLDAKLDEIRTLFGNLGEKHFRLLGIGHHEVHPFATQRFQIELNKIEEAAATQFNRASSLVLRRSAVVAEEFEADIATRVIHLFEIAHRESTTWMRGVFSGIERPLNELEGRLSTRSGKVDTVRSAELDLAEKLAGLQASLDVIKSKHAALINVREGLERFTGGHGRSSDADN